MRILIIAAIAAAAVATPVLAQPDLSGRDPHWIRDDATGCWAANPDPEPFETITWTGQCTDGLLSGKRQIHDDSLSRLLSSHSQITRERHPRLRNRRRTCLSRRALR